MTGKTAADSTVIVAALLSWHESHEAARQALEDALSSNSLVVPGHVLVESYSVLTRLPPPQRLSSKKALELLEKSFSALASPPTLDGQEIWKLLARFAKEGISGGAVYDALIAATAVKASASRLLTLNGRHMTRVAPDSLEIEVPGQKNL